MTLLLTGCGTATDPVDPDPVDKGLSIHVERISPDNDETGAVPCDALSSVDFVYRIRNSSSQAVTGLKLKVTCSCQKIGDLPNQIAVGETTEIQFRVNAPSVGHVARSIPLHCQQQAAPLVNLDASVRVRFEPPELLPRSDIHATFLAETAETRDVVLKAIENREADPWIQNLKCSSDVALWQPMEMTEQRQPDPDLVTRTYRFPFGIRRSRECGRHTSVISVQTTQGMPTIASPIRFVVEVIDSISVLPRSVTFSAQKDDRPQSRQLTVLRRDGQRLNVEPSFDRELLNVKRINSNAETVTTFEVTPRVKKEMPRNTQIMLNFDNEKSRTVDVLFGS